LRGRAQKIGICTFEAFTYQVWRLVNINGQSFPVEREDNQVNKPPGQPRRGKLNKAIPGRVDFIVVRCLIPIQNRHLNFKRTKSYF
jgi:hypothetical protein